MKPMKGCLKGCVIVFIGSIILITVLLLLNPKQENENRTQITQPTAMKTRVRPTVRPASVQVAQPTAHIAEKCVAQNLPVGKSGYVTCAIAKEHGCDMPVRKVE